MESQQAECKSGESERHAAVTAADIQERVKELQDQTGDLCETLDKIEKRLEEAAGEISETKINYYLDRR